MQEYVLSPRRLIFAEDQVHWVCQQCEWRESHHLESRSLRFAVPSDAWTTSFRKTTMLDLGPPDILKYRQSWEAVVQDYSARKLTLFEDRLHALQGIMTIAQPVDTPEHYYWGMSVRDFEVELAWHKNRVRHGPNEIGDSECYTPRTDCFPTWSWLSFPPRSSFSGLHKLSPSPLIKCFRLVRTPGGLLACRELSDLVPDRRYVWSPANVTVSVTDVEQQYSVSSLHLDRAIAFWGEVAHIEISWLSPHLALLAVDKDDPLPKGPWLTEISSMLDPCRKLYEFVAINTDYKDENYGCILLEWKDDVAHRVGFANIQKRHWQVLPKLRRLIVMC